MANDLLTALDVKQISLLSLLDLFAAFDTIDNPFYSPDSIWHFLALLCLGFSHTSDRIQVVTVNVVSSVPAALDSGVPRPDITVMVDWE